MERYIFYRFEQLCPSLKLFSGLEFIFVINCFYNRTITLHLFLFLRRHLHLAIYKRSKSFKTDKRSKSFTVPLYRVSQKSRTIQVSTENAFIDYSHNRCSNCAPTAMKQASNLSIKLSFTLLSVLLLIFGHSSSYCILVIVVI